MTGDRAKIIDRAKKLRRMSMDESLTEPERESWRVKYASHLETHGLKERDANPRQAMTDDEYNEAVAVAVREAARRYSSHNDPRVAGVARLAHAMLFGGSDD